MALLLTNSEIPVRAGIDSNYYKANFNSLSAYTHAHPFAISQLSKFRAGSDEALNLLNSKIETCTGYLCLAINGMSDLFPDQKTKIDSYEMKQLKSGNTFLKTLIRRVFRIRASSGRFCVFRSN